MKTLLNDTLLKIFTKKSLLKNIYRGDFTKINKKNVNSLLKF